MISGAKEPSGWRVPILAQFSPEIAAVARLTIVADPDELLTEPGVIEGIRDQGFEIIPFEDHVAFRYVYERRFRQIWDTGATTNLVVVLRASRSDLNGLPFDLLEQAKRDRRLLSFSLGDLFPSLAPHVLAELDRADLDAVYAAQELYQQGDLGENASRDFLLRNVFRIDSAQIHSEVDLLRILLPHHYAAKLLPGSLADRLVRLLRVSSRFQDWPLEAIVPSRVKFFESCRSGGQSSCNGDSRQGRTGSARTRKHVICVSPAPPICLSTMKRSGSTWTICSRTGCWPQCQAFHRRPYRAPGWLPASPAPQRGIKLSGSESCSSCTRLRSRTAAPIIMNGYMRQCAGPRLSQSDGR